MGPKIAYITNSYRGYQIRASYLNDGSNDAWIEIVDCDSTTVRDAKAPAYKIWNYSAHAEETIDEYIKTISLAAHIRHVPRVVEITSVLDAEPKSGHNPSTQSEAKAKLTTEGRTGIANIPTGTKLVVGSPAYQMPEIPSEAQKWAEKYRRDHALEHWVVDHLSAAYYAGHSAGFSDCATGVEVIVKSMGAK